MTMMDSLRFIWGIAGACIFLSSTDAFNARPGSSAFTSFHSTANTIANGQHSIHNSILDLNQIYKENDQIGVGRTSVQMQEKKKKVIKTKKNLKAKPKGFAAALRDLQMNTFKYSGSITPGTQTSQKIVTDPNVVCPDYAEDGIVSSFKIF